MNILKKISNLIFGTHYHVDIENYHNPSKKQLIKNMYREYGARDYW